MQKRLITNHLMLALLLIATLPAALAQENGNVFSLDQCIDYALKNRDAIKNADLERQIAKAKVGETRAIGLPQLNGSAELIDNFEVMTMFLPPDGFGPAPPGTPTDRATPINFGVRYTGQAAVGASQLLFDGVFFVGLQAAKTYRQLSDKSYIKTKQDVIENVAKAYYGALINEETKKLIDQNYERVDTLLKQTTIMFENGFSEQTDVDRIKVQLNNLAADRYQIEEMTKVSYMLLKFQMGMALDEEINLIDDMEDVVFDPNVKRVDNFSYSERIEYSMLETQRDLNALDIKQVKMAYLPNLYLTAVPLGYTSGGLKIREYDSWHYFGNWGVNLKVPIFDGFDKRYKIEQRRYKMMQTENDMKELSRSIDIEREQAFISLKSNAEKMKVQQENVALAERLLNVSKSKFQQGAGSSLDLVEAETSYRESINNYLSALYDAIISRIDYEKATGALGKYEPNAAE